ncbi:MAG: hypothetical protein Alpg2KO_28690 [Alphaproteobacteria bacterium]
MTDKKKPSKPKAGTKARPDKRPADKAGRAAAPAQDGAKSAARKRAVKRKIKAGPAAAAKTKKPFRGPDAGMLVAMFTGACLGAVMVAGWISLQSLSKREEQQLALASPSPFTSPQTRQSPDVTVRPPLFTLLPFPDPLPSPSVQEQVQASPAPLPSPSANVSQPPASPEPSPLATPNPSPLPSPTPSLQERAATGLDRLPDELEQLKGLIEAGRGEAAHDLALHYMSGHLIPRDIELGGYWMRIASQAGIGNAAYNLGMMQLRGIGMDRDEQAARETLEQAVKLDHVQAHHNLAILLLREDPISNKDRAIELLTTAYHAGHRDSALPVGILLKGADQAKQKVLWLEAASRNPADSGRALRELASEGWTARPLDQNRIIRLQQLLADLGGDPGPADGKPGERTRAALQDVMTRNGLPHDPDLTSTLLETLKALPTPVPAEPTADDPEQATSAAEEAAE